jgi:hypothetical protein
MVSGGRPFSRPDVPPPPPGPAQRLAARAGVVVYEGGNSLFDEPVLVYLPRAGTRWSGLTIHDHVDRVLGYTEKIGNPGAFTVNVAMRVADARGTGVLEVRAQPKIFRFIYEVSGVANGRYTMGTVGSQELSLEANNERFGYIKGQGFRGLAGKVLTIFDHDQQKVGELRAFVDHKNLFRQSVSYVLSVDPGLGGELRRMLVGAPIVVEGIRRSQQGSG